MLPAFALAFFAAADAAALDAAGLDAAVAFFFLAGVPICMFAGIPDLVLSCAVCCVCCERAGATASTESIATADAQRNA